MAKKKGAVAAKARAKRESQSGASDPAKGVAAATGPIVHGDGRRVHRGLMNLGNTCFINSVAQCLNVSLPFSDDLIGLASEGLDGMSGSLCTVMRGIRATDDTGASLQKFSPKDFQTDLVEKFPWYYGKQQHDAHEFLRTLLGAISDERTVEERTLIEEMTLGEGDCDGPLPDLDAPSKCGVCVGDNFKGHLLAASLCWSCCQVTARLDPFLDLSLDLPMPSGTCRKPLGVTAGLELGLPDSFDDEPPPEEGSSAAEVEAGPLIGRWAVKRDAEEVAALREITPTLIERIVVQILRKQGVAVKAEPDGLSVEITLSRDSKKKTPKWGFRWSDSRLQGQIFVVAAVAEESKLDKWNLKRFSTGSAERAIYPGDRLVEVNGEKEYEAMRQKLKHEDELELRFVRCGAQESVGGKMHDETDDEAEEKRAAAEAAMAERRKEFCEQTARCYEALPTALQGLFGAAKTSRKSGKDHLDLKHCLEQFSMVDAIEDDYQPVYSCGTCRSSLGRRTFASRRFWLWPAGLPPTLTIQLKRFRRYAADFVKSVTSVVLPAELDLGPHVLREDELDSLAAHAASGSDFSRLKEEMTARSGASFIYELYALCEHQGSAMEDGHYVAYVNSGPSLAQEEWFCISDAKLEKKSRAEVLKVEAYIAFYRRVAVCNADGPAEDAGQV